MTNKKFATVNISDCLEGRIEGFGEADLKRALATFYSIDWNVKLFLKNSAEDFAMQHKSVSCLVFSSDMAELLGYFTLAIKSITVDTKVISKTTERAFKKMGTFDAEKNAYTAPAFLIGQLGKNFSTSLKNSISGDLLLDGALYILKGVQRSIGGLIVFLETQNNKKLLSFYQSNGFKEFDRRMASSKEGENCELVQLIKVL